MTSLRFLPEQIEQWPVARLKPYSRNARTHSDDQIARIAASLVEYGWTAPVMVSDDGAIVAGHGRLLAAQHLGLNEVPIIRLSHLTPEQVRAYRIADNRLSELSGWDDELLAAELHALNAAGFDLALTGFEGEDRGARRRCRQAHRRRARPAVALLLVRSSYQMDVPTPTSYMMALVILRRGRRLLALRRCRAASPRHSGPRSAVAACC